MAGLEISEAGVLICKDYSGRPSGEAYVEILNEEHLEAAVEKHNENMGHRWGLVVLQFLVSHPTHLLIKPRAEPTLMLESKLMLLLKVH